MAVFAENTTAVAMARAAATAVFNSIPSGRVA
jgi:hypothetical protein